MDIIHPERKATAGEQSTQLALTTASRMLPAAAVWIRVAFGLWLLIHEAILEKLFTWTPKTLPTIFATFAKNHAAYGFYKFFLLNVAIPNAEFFRTLITTWEIVFAICLILGLGLRVLIPFQIFANINYILAKTYPSPAAHLDRLAIIILVTMFLLSAGRYYGLDGYLRRRFPRLSWL
jgi:hypothetical protein